MKPQFRTCTTCNAEKLSSLFGWDDALGKYRSHCKACGKLNRIRRAAAALSGAERNRARKHKPSTTLQKVWGIGVSR